jgi:kynurenine formamidase
MRVRSVGSPLLLLILASFSGCAEAPGDEGGKEPPRLDESKLVDLTYSFDASTLYWPTATSFELEALSYGQTPAGYWYAANTFCAPEHGGTHLDSPIHFGEGKWTADAIPVERFVGPAAVIDVGEQCELDSDYALSERDLLDWEAKHGHIPDGAIVLMRSGWGKFWPDRNSYFGSETPEDTRTLHFPGFSPEAAAFLTKQRLVDAVGLDTPSLDHGPSDDFQAHQVFAEANVPGFENVANLDRLPPAGAWIIALPVKIGGGTGGPLRIVALLP